MMQFLAKPSANQRFWLLMALTGLVLFFRLGAAPIYILDEAKNAQCAREMWSSGNWIVPTFNGQLRTDKPALHYWFMMLAYQCFGVSPFSARFFSAVFGLATVWLTHNFVKRHHSPNAALYTALALCLSTHVVFEFRLSVPDPYLIFFTTAGLCSAYNYYALGKRHWLLAAAAMLGLATLAKGPIALALPGLALLLLLLLRRQWRRLWDLNLVWAAMVYAAVTLPWYWAVHKATQGVWTKGFFFEHNLNRFSGQMEGHGGFFLVTALVALLGMLPFSLLLFTAFQKKWQLRTQPIFVFAAIVVGLYIVFFSISSTKLPNYAMPCYPFQAIVAGLCLHAMETKKSVLPRWMIWTLLLVSTALPFAGFFAIKEESSVAHLRGLAWPMLVLPLGLTLSFFFAQKTKKMYWLPGLTAAYTILNLYFSGVAYPKLYQQNPVSSIYSTLARGKNFVVAYKVYNPAFNFQFKSNSATVPVFFKNDSLQKYLMTAYAHDGKIFVLTRQNLLNELDTSHLTLIAAKKDLFELPTTAVLQWKP